MKKNVYIIIDGQAGSCGKGKVIGQMALDKKIEVAISNCMPNAGHTFEMNGKRRVFRHIPVSAVNPNTILFMGAGTAIDMNVLEQEYEENKDILDGREIIVHPNALLIREDHKEKERAEIRSGSTFKGGGAALAEKIMRSPNTTFFKEYKNIKADINYHEKLIHYLKTCRKILIEGSQGCGLDIDHSNHFPNTAGRQIGVAKMCSDSGISPLRIKDITLVIRPFPIRISNETELGKNIYSGNYGNSKELSWDQVSIGASIGQYPTVIDPSVDGRYKTVDLTETTTVTKKTRRIFDIDIEQLKKVVDINTPMGIYLNFFEQLDYSYHKSRGEYGKVYIDKYRREYINWLESETDVPVVMLGTGADYKDYISREKYVKSLRKK
jgi:adenylosuccinate synthase